jgi:hypothetical protein
MKEGYRREGSSVGREGRGLCEEIPNKAAGYEREPLSLAGGESGMVMVAVNHRGGGRPDREIPSWAADDFPASSFSA